MTPLFLHFNYINYHSVYVAEIDNGKNLPAQPVKIGSGYWPSWSYKCEFWLLLLLWII
jgi:hypothetical protein